MSSPIELNRAPELQWDWARIQRNPLGNDAAFAAFVTVTQSASLAGFIGLDGRSASGVNAYVRLFSLNFSVNDGYGLGYYTGAISFTAATAIKLGNTTASANFIPCSTTRNGFFGTNFDQGGILASTNVDLTRGNWLMVPAGSMLLLQGDLNSSVMNVAMQWCEYSD